MIIRFYTAASVEQPMAQDLDPYLHDPLRWGASMSQPDQPMRVCPDAVGARLGPEVGVGVGDLTRVLAAGSGARACG